MTKEVVPGAHDENDTLERSTHLIALGLLAGDLTPTAIARYADVTKTDANHALHYARLKGLFNADETDAVDDITRAQLIADFPRHDQARIHAAVARHKFTAGPEQLSHALHHIRAAAHLATPEPMVALADQGGRLGLSLGKYQAAHDLLALADELDSPTNLISQGNRFCDLATAADGLGHIEQARQHLARAMTLGELACNAPLVARAAVMDAPLATWNAGNPHTAAFLQRAEAMPQSPNAQVAIRAARALAELHIPAGSPHDQQYAWITRTAVAQPLAEQAVADSKNCDPEVQCFALMAWRSTHRAPRFLEQRCEVSAHIVDLAQQVRRPSMQVDGAAWLAVDALESGNRGLYDEAISVARWVSHTDGNPRLRWRALTLELGAALLDDDTDTAERLHAEVRGLSHSSFSPGQFAVDMFFTGEEIIGRDDPTELASLRLPDDTPGLANAVARAAMGYVYARTGDAETARRHARLALRQLDSELSYVLVATRVAAIAHAVNDKILARDALALLTPWVNHVSVDGNGWWCDGPVALWLAMLHHTLGDNFQAQRHLQIGETSATALNDVRSLRRAAALRQQLACAGVDPTAHPIQLTTRESIVLEMLATGASHPTIARSLAYSLSTIRNETMSIYRKLGVSGRPDAVARAMALGLIQAIAEDYSAS